MVILLLSTSETSRVGPGLSRERNLAYHISVTIVIPEATLAILVLTKQDTRAFQDLSGTCDWSLDFKLFKKGGTIPIASSLHNGFQRRSVQVEKALEAGEYVVHVSAKAQSETQPDFHLQVRLDRYVARTSVSFY